MWRVELCCFGSSRWRVCGTKQLYPNGKVQLLNRKVGGKVALCNHVAIRSAVATNRVRNGRVAVLERQREQRPQVLRVCCVLVVTVRVSKDMQHAASCLRTVGATVGEA